MRSVFFGSPEFVTPVLNKLFESDSISVKGVVTTPSSPVASCAKQLRIPTYSLKGFEEKYLSNEEIADIYIVAAFGKFLSEKLFTKPKYQTLIIHPSLLPKLRGTSPVKTAILERHTETGVSIILMEKGMDTGPIIAQARVSLSGEETFAKLILELFSLGTEMLLELLPFWKNYSNYQLGLPENWKSETRNIKLFLPPSPQDHAQATYTQKLTRENGKIDWGKNTEEVDRMVRALNPWPGAWTTFAELSTAKMLNAYPVVSRVKCQHPSIGGKIIKLLQTHLENGNLIIDRLQVEGRKSISWREFKAGYL